MLAIKKKKSKTPAVGVKSNIRVVKKQLTAWRPLVLTRHPSHAPLRRGLCLLPFRAVVRLGSTTPSERRIECNSVQGVKNSSSKLLMKQCFTRAGVKTANWFVFGNDSRFWGTQNNVAQSFTRENLPYPIVAKSHNGSRGVGNFKLDTQGALEEWMRGKTLSHYIFEEFSTFSKEYRIHVTNDGCFYTCRKLLKNTAPEGTWQRHDDGTVSWILEDNEAFKKPSTWNLIVQDCIKAKNSLGLDICSFDVMTQGSNHPNPEWVIIESQSAPSFGNVTLAKYSIEIPKVLRQKYELNKNN